MRNYIILFRISETWQFLIQQTTSENIDEFRHDYVDDWFQLQFTLINYY